VLSSHLLSPLLISLFHYGRARRNFGSDVVLSVSAPIFP
jgi:hypothetical protein